MTTQPTTSFTDAPQLHRHGKKLRPLGERLALNDHQAHRALTWMLTIGIDDKQMAQALLGDQHLPQSAGDPNTADAQERISAAGSCLDLMVTKREAREAADIVSALYSNGYQGVRAPLETRTFIPAGSTICLQQQWPGTRITFKTARNLVVSGERWPYLREIEEPRYTHGRFVSDVNGTPRLVVTHKPYVGFGLTIKVLDLFGRELADGRWNGSTNEICDEIIADVIDSVARSNPETDHLGCGFNEPEEPEWDCDDVDIEMTDQEYVDWINRERVANDLPPRTYTGDLIADGF
ncbi:hypothetical protein [Nocardioides pinisoli]|uniref:Uncharacterized protein n=1 Tax=Nocardioides pinisoli TaxID=2950279 RepID=A0ABT1KRG4_9ACTN|nr:hypothetical protein [Nocardioides pinisoli]MCP3420330.1 hypothetical protein [Nocardioides pinisoli]